MVSTLKNCDNCELDSKSAHYLITNHFLIAVNWDCYFMQDFVSLSMSFQTVRYSSYASIRILWRVSLYKYFLVDFQKKTARKLTKDFRTKYQNVQKAKWNECWTSAGACVFFRLFRLISVWNVYCCCIFYSIYFFSHSYSIFFVIQREWRKNIR